MTIRSATAADEDAIWAVLEPVVRAGETLTLQRDWSRELALAFWRAPQHDVFVAEEDGKVLGTYFFRPNHSGGGSHVGNCGYVTHPDSTGKGIARAMCLHSIEHAKSKGYRAIQFNFVISTNERAVRLWQSLGFEIVGTLPGAFKHPSLGYVDVFVMYMSLGQGA